ncbi:uncharacterized protein N7482_006602 [Penicillium canariense]|uniref:Uncharacterized protein n=1 Tax=Penicillium canariense TaxID=189055 RepID=A0A9W9HXG2_9EURO|nr:uncharacterized protein N7482_006602 [Penicillium canariense]KAJ5159598.1 hypothetical protein N7482_006602 [Penicillium canariense]
MGLPRDNDPAPDYEEVFEQQPSNPLMGVTSEPFSLGMRLADMRGQLQDQLRGFSGPYARVVQSDQDIDVEPGESHHHNSSTSPLQQGIALGAGPSDGQPHVHCKVCDAQMERREKRRAETEHCQIVSRTFILITLFLMIVAIIAVTSALKKKH